MAYLVLLKVRAPDIRPGHSWSACALKPRFVWEVSTQQLKRTARHAARREAKVLRAA